MYCCYNSSSYCCKVVCTNVLLYATISVLLLPASTGDISYNQITSLKHQTHKGVVLHTTVEMMLLL